MKRTNIDGSETDLKRVNGASELSHTYTLQKEDNGLHFYCDVDGKRSQNDVYFNVTFK